MTYTLRLEKAIRFATYAHQNQFRKETKKLPYISHPFAVSVLISEYTDNEDIIIAGLLHDILEDTDTSEEELKEHFGTKVQQLVSTVSEPHTDNGKMLAWRERKEAYLTQIAQGDSDALYIVAADKIHNMQSKERFLEEAGENAHRYFGGSREDYVWYYSSIFEILVQSSLPLALLERYKRYMG